MGGVLPETVASRELAPSPHGWVHDVSMGVHPPCPRGSCGIDLKESQPPNPIKPHESDHASDPDKMIELRAYNAHTQYRKKHV